MNNLLLTESSSARCDRADSALTFEGVSYNGVHAMERNSSMSADSPARECALFSDDVVDNSFRDDTISTDIAREEDTVLLQKSTSYKAACSSTSLYQALNSHFKSSSNVSEHMTFPASMSFEQPSLSTDNDDDSVFRENERGHDFRTSEGVCVSRNHDVYALAGDRSNDVQYPDASLVYHDTEQGELRNFNDIDHDKRFGGHDVDSSNRNNDFDSPVNDLVNIGLNDDFQGLDVDVGNHENTFGSRDDVASQYADFGSNTIDNDALHYNNTDDADGQNHNATTKHIVDHTWETQVNETYENDINDFSHELSSDYIENHDVDNYNKTPEIYGDFVEYGEDVQVQEFLQEEEIAVETSPSESGRGHSGGSGGNRRVGNNLGDAFVLDMNYDLQQGYRILREIMSDTNKSVNWPFIDAIDASVRGCEDYYKRTKKPIWLWKSTYFNI